MTLTRQRIAIVDMVLRVFQHFHTYRRVGWSESFPLKIFFSCSLGGGGRYFSSSLHLVFLGNCKRKSPQIVNYYGDRESIRRSLFNTAMSFGNLQGLTSWAWLPKFCRNFWGSVWGFFSWFSTMPKVPQNPPAEPQRFCRLLGLGLGSPCQSFEDWLFSSQNVVPPG